MVNLSKLCLLFVIFSAIGGSFVIIGCGSDQSVKTITISPSSVSVGVGRTQQFFAAAYDLSGAILSKTFAWSVEGNIGSINSSGILTAVTAEATGYVVATADNVSAKSSVSITTKGTVSGKIRNSDGTNIANIVAALTDIATYSATSNSTGDYSISSVPYGTHEVKTRETVQYLSTSTEAFVTTGETTTANIALQNRLSIENEDISGSPITISGKVKNNGTTEAKSVTIAYFFYDSEGTLASSASQSLGNIGASVSHSFSAMPIPPIVAYSTVTKTVAASSY